jgi:hypothetical protein
MNSIQVLQQTAAAILVVDRSLSLSAAAAAERVVRQQPYSDALPPEEVVGE